MLFQGIRPSAQAMGLIARNDKFEATREQASGIRHRVIGVLVACQIVASGGATEWQNLPEAATMDQRDRELLASVVDHIPNMFVQKTK